MARVPNKEFLDKVKERDAHRCVVCDRKPLSLEVHHLWSYAQNPKLRLDVDNGVSVCSDCHKEFHKMYTKNRFTKIDFYEYKYYKRLTLDVIGNAYNEDKRVEKYNELAISVWEDEENQEFIKNVREYEFDLGQIDTSFIFSEVIAKARKSTAIGG